MWEMLKVSEYILVWLYVFLYCFGCFSSGWGGAVDRVFNLILGRSDRSESEEDLWLVGDLDLVVLKEDRGSGFPQSWKTWTFTSGFKQCDFYTENLMNPRKVMEINKFLKRSWKSQCWSIYLATHYFDFLSQTDLCKIIFKIHYPVIWNQKENNEYL